MGNKKSRTNHKYEAAQTSTLSKDAVLGGRIDNRMIQNMLLIWLGNNLSDNSADCRDTIIQLRRVVNTIKKYTDSDQCIEFLETMQNENVCMIISGILGQRIVPRIHDMPQVKAIFIFCGNKEYHEQWAKEWPKIKGVFSGTGPICEGLKTIAEQFEHDSIPMGFMAIEGDISKTSLDQLEPSFIYIQIMKEILLSSDFKQQHIDEFTQYCREVLAENDDELKKLKRFERQYHDKTPILWFTYDCFLHSMLNRALQLMDTDTIIKIGFFIVDLHRHIEKLHQEQFSSGSSKQNFTVYRGQGVTKTDFDQISKTQGGLMSFNNFLTTSKNRNVSLRFATRTTTNTEMVGVLFTITIDPTQSTTPFASIKDVSYFADAEDEVLFSLYTIFRIGEITPLEENKRLFQVKLMLINDNDKDLRALTDRIQKETDGDDKGWYRLGSLLLKMGQLDKARQVYKIVLEQTTDESEKGAICQRLGLAHFNKGSFQDAVTFYENSIETYKKQFPQSDLTLAAPYDNIGLAYDSMGNYQNALSSYEQALAIKEQSLPPNHPDLAVSHENIAIAYRTMGDYQKALSSYEKVLAIKEQSLPSNHIHLAKYYMAEGLVYNEMMKYPEAIEFCEKAIKIQQESNPRNYSDLADFYNNIGLVYDNMCDYPKALSFHEKALAIRQQILPSNHRQFGLSYNNIGAVYYEMGDYSKALSYYEKDLEICRQTLPPDHPDFGGSYNNIGLVYESMENYSEAHSFFERAVDIGERFLPIDDGRLQDRKKSLERVKKKL